MDSNIDPTADPTATAELTTAPSANEIEAPAPWQMIEPGRYQPRRIRGSCVGRELG